MTSRRTLIQLTIAGAAVLALAGCGSSSSSGTSASQSAPASTPAASTPAASAPSTAAGGASSGLALAANSEGQLKYETASLTAKAGAVTIDFTNNAQIAHNVTVADASGAVVGATPTFAGGSKTLSLNLKPGTYKYYCSVPGHREAGMEGTLTVK